MRAFTLLEVVIALAILSMSLVAILNINAQALSTHVYAHKLSIATWLARSKMVDLEQDLYDKPLGADDEEMGGDFSLEGWPSYKWRARIVVPRTANTSPMQLLGALFQIPTGADGSGTGSGNGNAIASLFADAGAGAAIGNAQGGTGGFSAGGLGGGSALSGLLQGPFAQMVAQIQQSVREVQLTVSWKEGVTTESIDLATHIVSLGPGSDRNGGGLATAGLGSGSASLVRPDGTPAQNPTPCPGGSGMCDSDGAVLHTASTLPVDPLRTQ